MILMVKTKKEKITKNKKDKVTKKEEKKESLTINEMKRNIRTKVSGVRRWH